MNTTIHIIEQLNEVYTYIDFRKEVIDNDPKFRAGDHVRISKYKNIFC